jgi:hypothetical protein
MAIKRIDEWYGGEEGWVVVGQERIGNKDVAVVSVMFSVPREPKRKSRPNPVWVLEAA